MLLPLVVLALQKDGTLTLQEAERYLALCKSRNRIYSVVCCVLPSTSYRVPKDTEETVAFAHERALLALDNFPDAAVGVGLQSTNIMFCSQVGIMPVRTAAAALVARKNRHRPPLVAFAADDAPGVAAHLVANALTKWQKQLQPSQGDLVQRVVKKAVNI